MPTFSSSIELKLVFADKFIFINSKIWINVWKSICFPANVLRQKTELISWCTATRQQRGRSCRGWWGRWRARSPARPSSLSSLAPAAIGPSSDAAKKSWTRWRRTSKSARAEFNTRSIFNGKQNMMMKTGEIIIIIKIIMMKTGEMFQQDPWGALCLARGFCGELHERNLRWVASDRLSRTPPNILQKGEKPNTC